MGRGDYVFLHIASQQLEIATFRDAFAAAASMGRYPRSSLAEESDNSQGSARKALPVHSPLGVHRMPEREPVTLQTISATSSQVT